MSNLFKLGMCDNSNTEIYVLSTMSVHSLEFPPIFSTFSNESLAIRTSKLVVDEMSRHSIDVCAITNIAIWN